MTITLTPTPPAPAPHFEPRQLKDSGSRVGNSYLSAFLTCPWSFFNNYLRPTELNWENLDLGVEIYLGVRPRVTKWYFLTGRIFHEGLAQWYLSGCAGGEDNGQRDIESAMDIALQEYNKCKQEFETPTKAEDEWNMVRVMLRAYHDAYGPDSVAPEWPQTSVYCDPTSGEAWIEKAFELDLGYNNYIFTSKPDAVVRVDGYVRTRDHKTSSAYGVSQRKAKCAMDPQFTGEYMVLADKLPEGEVYTGCEANIVIKNRSANSKFGVRELVTSTRTPEDILDFRIKTIATLRRIDDSVALLGQYRTEGKPLELAAQMAFPRFGPNTGGCDAYGGCQLLDLCGSKRQLASNLRHGYLQRELDQVVEMKERPA